jgi:hypothetical protein
VINITGALKISFLSNANRVLIFYATVKMYDDFSRHLVTKSDIHMTRPQICLGSGHVLALERIFVVPVSQGSSLSSLLIPSVEKEFGLTVIQALDINHVREKVNTRKQTTRMAYRMMNDIEEFGGTTTR